MDPHSRLSQFNQRQPKSGPLSRLIDSMPPKDPQINPLKPSHKAKTASAQNAALLIRRPIATNSRIKQGENLRRDMYLAFVNNALQEQSQGKSASFNELVNQFSLKPFSPDTPQNQPGQVRFWILALSHVVSRLEKSHSALVQAIVNMPWTTLGSTTVKSYTVFIGMLLSARPEYLSLVLSKIVQGFTHQSGIQALDVGMPEGSSRPLTRRIIYDRLHYLLSHILALIPTLPSTLQPILVRHFPHKRQNQLAQTTYIRNMLRISTYCPALADKILATIIDQAIQIDVEIQVELEELEDENSPDHDVFEFDAFDVVVGQEGDEFNSDDETELDNGDDFEDDFSDLSSEGGDDEPHADLPTNIKHVQEMVKKLDAILTLMFEHFNRSLAQYVPASTSVTSSNEGSSLLDLSPLPPLSSSPPATPTTLTPPPVSASQTSRADILRTTFHALLSIFDRTILNTFKSRYTQFLIFWYTSLDPEFADIFQGMLVDRALFSSNNPGGSVGSSSTAELTRAAAASYIGSFVSRATFVDRDGTRRVVGILCDYLNAHLEDVDEAIREHGPSWISFTTPSQHTVFYAVAQAVFLIFCFRWRDLQEDLELDDEISSSGPKVAQDKWIPHLQILKRVVLSVLNPLKICSPGVVMQFAKVAHQTDFMYCYSILESNKRAEYNGGSPSNGLHPSFLRGQLNNELNTFFPFDPYRLPKSNAFIETVYREWSSVAIGEDEDDDSYDEDSDQDEESEEESERSSSSGVGNLDIPRPYRQNDSEDGALEESMIAMSISPNRTSNSVVMSSSLLASSI